jgi:hypothetical protein
VDPDCSRPGPRLQPAGLPRAVPSVLTACPRPPLRSRSDAYANPGVNLPVGVGDWWPIGLQGPAHARRARAGTADPAPQCAAASRRIMGEPTRCGGAAWDGEPLLVAEALTYRSWASPGWTPTSMPSASMIAGVPAPARGHGGELRRFTHAITFCPLIAGGGISPDPRGIKVIGTTSRS